MLNATMCAVSRTICALLENYQTEEGIALPQVLKPFMPEGMDFLKFSKSAPIDEQPEAKKQKKKGKNKSGTQTEGCLEAKLENIDVSKDWTNVGSRSLVNYGQLHCSNDRKLIQLYKVRFETVSSMTYWEKTMVACSYLTSGFNVVWIVEKALSPLKKQKKHSNSVIVPKLEWGLALLISQIVLNMKDEWCPFTECFDVTLSDKLSKECIIKDLL